MAIFAAISAAMLTWSTGSLAQPAPPSDAPPPPPPLDTDAPPQQAGPPDALGTPPSPPEQVSIPPVPLVEAPPQVPLLQMPSAPALDQGARPPPSGFFFSSYGRMITATDFHGRPGRDADIVAHGSRLDESNYVELTLRRDDAWSKTDSTTRLVATLAVANPVFHYNGEFNLKAAIRNLYLEESDLGLRGLSVWAGSRMYRGDDIYLLDWWPLDNLNTVGAGARYEISKATSAALQGGLTLPKSIFYLQDSERPSVFNQLGATTVNILSRQRFIGSAKVTHEVQLSRGDRDGDRPRLRGALYAELHRLPSGQRESEALPRVFENLPSDGGFVIGAQVGARTSARNTHVNLFLRYATGLAAYGEFAAPDQLGQGATTQGAHELLAALGANWEKGPFGLMVGAYVRSFRNASEDLDLGDVDEGIVALRPHVFFGEIGGLAVEGSFQAMQRGVVTTVDADNKPTDAKGPFSASLFRIGFVPFLSPAGRGDYSRPQLRLIYLVTVRGKEARQLYPQDDVFSLHGVEHFFGVGAEWWLNQTSYGG